MSYKPEVYVKARGLLEKRRKDAEQAQLLRRAEVLSVCPEIQKLEQEMASFGAEAIRLVAGHENSDIYLKNLSQKSLEIQRKRKQMLVEIGFPADYLDTKYTCSKCNDKGERDGYYCECYKELIVQCARSLVAPISLLDASSFETFDIEKYSDEVIPEIKISPRFHMKNVLDFCRNYAENFSLKSSGIFMFGQTGLGKTHLSLAIADAVTKKGYDVCYTPAQNAMNRLEKEHFGKGNDEGDYIDELLGADLLILDDLGTEFSTSFTVAQIYNIINTRIIDKKPTIISTNLTPDEIEGKYSQRLSSRLIGSFTPIRFLGSDIRQQR